MYINLARSTAYWTSTCKIATQDVRVSLVNRRADMVKFGDEGVFEPVHEHLGDHHREHGLSPY